jgi:molybdopterin-guanine dinucleotide biosynthesis protein A
LTTEFAGAVLTGGASSRMGRDKALLEVGGRPMAAIAASALRDAGAVDVVSVGGDRAGLEALGLRWMADAHPGEGPLGAIITALEATTTDLVAVLACDLPAVTAAAVRQIVDGVEGDGAIAQAGGRVHPLLAAYRRSCLLPLRTAFDAGVRKVRTALDGLTVVEVALDDPAWATNVNRPDDVAFL